MRGKQMLWFFGTVVVLGIAGAIWGYRREVEYRRRTGETRPDRHDPGQNYLPPPPPAG